MGRVSQKETGQVSQEKEDGLEPSEELEVDVTDLEPDEQESVQVQGGIMKTKHDTAKNTISNVH
jgi:hypothetical protein